MTEENPTMSAPGGYIHTSDDLEAIRERLKLPETAALPAREQWALVEKLAGEQADAARKRADGPAETEAGRRVRTIIDGTESDALALLAEDRGPAARPLAAFDGKPGPEPVIWRDDGDAHREAGDKWPLVSVGEPGLLAAGGGSGKSYVALALALACAGDGAACGLRVRKGPALLLSYEDSPIRMAIRTRRILGKAAPGELHVLPDPGPLLAVNPGEIGAPILLPELDRLARECQRLRPSLVVIDPAGEALADADAADAGAVRRWYAAAMQAIGGDAGLLLIAHSTKASRNLAAAGDDAGAGAVAGSAAWFDRARGVAHMRKAADGGKLLHVIKSNHGRAGWGSLLAEKRTESGKFAGWELAGGGELSPDQVDAELARIRAAQKAKFAGGKTGGDALAGESRNAAADAGAGGFDGI